MVAISAVAYLCILVLVHFIFPSQEIKDLKGDFAVWFPHNEGSPLSTLPIFVFAYTCHHNVFAVINEQKKTRFAHVKVIAIIAMLLALVLYVLIGGAGYFTFGNHIVGNIITLYPHSITSTIGRVAIVFLVTLAFPLQCHPARASIHHIICYIKHKAKKRDQNQQIKVSGPIQIIRSETESATLLNNETEEPGWNTFTEHADDSHVDLSLIHI